MILPSRRAWRTSSVVRSSVDSRKAILWDFLGSKTLLSWLNIGRSQLRLLCFGLALKELKIKLPPLCMSLLWSLFRLKKKQYSSFIKKKISACDYPSLWITQKVVSFWHLSDESTPALSKTDSAIVQGVCQTMDGGTGDGLLDREVNRTRYDDDSVGNFLLNWYGNHYVLYLLLADT